MTVWISVEEKMACRDKNSLWAFFVVHMLEMTGVAAYSVFSLG